jgi:RNA recognition motif-containing protein
MDRKPREFKPRTDKVESSDRPEGDRKPRGGRPQSTRKVSYTRSNKDDCSIYIGNMSFRTTEMNLGRLFEKYGDIKNVRIIEDRET